jgi:acetyltransferase-like isoleucine patch superfamily enzyme
MTIMSRGTRVVVKGGRMEIGHNFFCNGDCCFNCTTSINIGNNNMYGWNINFNTTDGHHIYIDGKEGITKSDIVIGNHVWIGSYCNIAKGAKTADDTVIAQNSLVTKQFSEINILIGGVPAKKIKDNVSWKS